MNDFMVRADVTYRRDTWSALAQYKLQGNSLTSSASYISPTRTINYDMELNANSNKAKLNANLKWDAERDSTKAVSYYLYFSH